MGKSFRAKKDKEMIKINEDICSVEVEYEKSDREGKIKIEIGNKKNFYKRNKNKKVKWVIRKNKYSNFHTRRYRNYKRRTRPKKKIPRYYD